LDFGRLKQKRAPIKEASTPWVALTSINNVLVRVASITIEIKEDNK
jgi:hypothetical protein